MREPSVAVVWVAPGLHEREKRPLCMPPQKLRRRIRTAFDTALHPQTNILYVKLEPFDGQPTGTTTAAQNVAAFELAAAAAGAGLCAELVAEDEEEFTP